MAGFAGWNVRMTLVRRLHVAYVVAALQVACLGLVGYHFVEQHLREMRALLEADIEIGTVFSQLHMGLLQLTRLQRLLLSGTAPSTLIKEADGHADQVVAAMATLSRALRAKETLPLLDETQSRVTDYLTTLRSAFEGKTPLNEAGLRLQSLAFETLMSARRLGDHRWRKLGEREEQVRQLDVRAEESMLVLMVLTIVSLAILGYLVPRGLALPFRSLGRTLEQLGEGNLGARAPEEGTSELQQLARLVNRAASNLRRFDELKVAMIHDKEMRLRGLANLFTRGCVLFGEDGRIAYANHSFLTSVKLTSNDLFERAPLMTPLARPLAEGLQELLSEGEEHGERFITLEGGPVPETVRLQANIHRAPDGRLSWGVILATFNTQFNGASTAAESGRPTGRSSPSRIVAME